MALIMCQRAPSTKRATGRRLTLQTWCISGKIKQVDDAVTPESQNCAFEVHPEVCSWSLNKRQPMLCKKMRKQGARERLTVLKTVFPEIECHLLNRPPDVGKDDLLDAAVAAWTARRMYSGEACQVCGPERDEKGLSATIWY